MSDKKIAVIFPGKNYSADSPLLYYACFTYEVRGYEVVPINYGDLLKQDKPISECVKEVMNAALMQLQAIDLSNYDDIVFVSKSLGTVVAGWIDEKLCINVRHIFLTPVDRTLPYITKERNIIAVVSGTKDEQMDEGILKEHCIKENIYLKQIEGAGHRLEIWGDMDRNIDILKEVAALYQ